MLLRACILIIFFNLLVVLSFAQTNSTNTLVAGIDTFHSRVPREKVFLHINKSGYNVNDTIWMKAYVLNDNLGYSAQSGLLYVELINDSSQVVMRECIPVRMGMGYSQMPLDDKTVKEGSYTLRAYTNWMQNIGEAGFFNRQISISDADNGSWLVDKAVQVSGAGHFNIAMQFMRLNKTLLRLKGLRLQVKSGNRIIIEKSTETDIEGRVKTSFNLPANAYGKNLSVIVQGTDKGANNPKLVIPLDTVRTEETDLQFMPEGGQMVAGLPCKVAFKALSPDGKGIDVSGNIVDSQGKTVTGFRSVHGGMGYFNIIPVANEKYTARVKLPDGSYKTYNLPAAAASGLVMHIISPKNKDSLLLVVSTSTGLKNTAQNFSLIGQSRGKVCFASHFSSTDSAISGWVPKDKFPSGIARFTIFNDSRMPVAERSVFIDYQDSLLVSINTESKSHQPGDSVVMHINTADKYNNPVSGSFSVAVNDEDEVGNENNDAANIYSYMLLSGDLQGNVEAPGYYFNPKNADKDEALDNLLLTQGWVNYSWNDVFSKDYRPKFRAVPEIEVTGQVSRTGRKNTGGLPVYLLSIKKPELILNTITDPEGKFIFKDFPRIDTVDFLLQVKDIKGKAFEARITVDKFNAAGITQKSLPPLTPWYVNTDSTQLQHALKYIAANSQADKMKYPAGTRQLKEVIVKGRRMIKGSQWRTADGVPDVVLTEVDMRKADKMTLEEVLFKMIKGFGITSLPCGCVGDCLFDYEINCQPLRLSIDGFPVDQNYMPPEHFSASDHYYYIQNYLTTLKAEDVRGIEVLNRGYNDGVIEVTTWSGYGAFLKRTHGTYLYRPLPITWPVQFYQPKYSVKENPQADSRATVFWEPNIMTDKDGNATVTFFTKGKPASYSITVQGSDLNSSVGYKRMVLRVK